MRSTLAKLPWSALAIIVACKSDPKPALGETIETESEHQAPKPAQPKWYEGGTLSGANGLDWQTATPGNKLATCADILAKLWVDKKLKDDISSKFSSVDDLRPLAAQLVTALDKAFVGSTDPKENQRMLVNQSVASTAILVMKLMDWLQINTSN